jgi:hypothetical protein
MPILETWFNLPGVSLARFLSEAIVPVKKITKQLKNERNTEFISHCLFFNEFFFCLFPADSLFW